MKCHGTSLTWTRRVWAWEERSRWIGPTTRFEQNIKGEVKKCVVNTALFDQREVRIWNGRDFIQRICKSRWSHGDCHDEIFSDCRWFLWPFLQRTIICFEQDRSSTEMHNVTRDMIGSQRIQLALSIVRGQVIGARFYGVVNGPCLSWSIEKLLQSLLASTLHD